jgi:UDPglucose 6-dehydrogenase
MKISVIGTEYVGLVTGTCFAEVGINATCFDIESKKIENLRKGISPIYEPGLDSMIQRNILKNNLHFSTDLASSIAAAEVVFIAVGTPPDEDGSADLKYVIDVAKSIGKYMQEYLLVVTKSTVPWYS